MDSNAYPEMIWLDGISQCDVTSDTLIVAFFACLQSALLLVVSNQQTKDSECLLVVSLVRAKSILGNSPMLVFLSDILAPHICLDLESAKLVSCP